jgi:RimK-like ATP-grasp domain
MILLWGLGIDGPLRAVDRGLRARGVPVARFDISDVERIAVDVRIDVGARGRLRGPEHDLELARVSAGYLRPYSACETPAVRAAGPGSALWRHAVEVDSAVAAWAELTPAFVLNRPSPHWELTSKPTQRGPIEACGFAFPPTLVTTDPAAVRAFAERHGRLISKGLGATRSIVRMLDADGEARLDDVTICPTQFQAWIPGEDVRVHVVGERVFATRIECEAVDYRYAGRDDAARRMTAGRLPDALAERCIRLARAFELDFAGIDLRRDPDGRWFCFEVNPAPGFTFFSDASGQRIADAVADLLTEPQERRVAC